MTTHLNNVMADDWC